MGSLKLIILLLLFISLNIDAQHINSTHLLDLFIRDYTFKSYNMSFRTGQVYSVHLPANFSGIEVHTASFRCGSLRRRGAQVKEFHLGIGVTVQPTVEKVMVIRQNLGHHWSPMYYANYDLSGYQIVSSILGLLGYNVNFSNNFELGIEAGKNPITIDFSNATRITNTSGISPLCVAFENNGNVTLKNPISPYVCAATRQGHYGLVVKSRAGPPPEPVERKISLWKVVVGSSVGSALGAGLLVLLLVAMFVKVKKKAKKEEMERRAYEEEALQVSMVGHVRAPMAAQTIPAIGYQ